MLVLRSSAGQTPLLLRSQVGLLYSPWQWVSGRRWIDKWQGSEYTVLRIFILTLTHVFNEYSTHSQNYTFMSTKNALTHLLIHWVSTHSLMHWVSTHSRTHSSTEYSTHRLSHPLSTQHTEGLTHPLSIQNNHALRLNAQSLITTLILIHSQALVHWTSSHSFTEHSLPHSLDSHSHTLCSYRLNCSQMAGSILLGNGHLVSNPFQLFTPRLSSQLTMSSHR
jgi:hypothetical protein